MLQGAHLFEALPHPGQVPPAPIHPLALSSWPPLSSAPGEGRFVNRTRFVPLRMLDVGAGFCLPGPWPVSPLAGCLPPSHQVMPGEFTPPTSTQASIK